MVYGTMASDVWGFSKTCLVFVCFFVVCTLTTETEEEIDNGITVALFSEY